MFLYLTFHSDPTSKEVKEYWRRWVCFWQSKTRGAFSYMYMTCKKSKNQGFFKSALFRCTLWVVHYFVSLLGNFSEKCILKLVELISGHCLTIKTATKRPFIGCALQILGFCSRCKLSPSKFSACVESKILRQFWGLKVTHHWVLTSTFHFLYSSLLSLFLHCFFFHLLVIY